MSTWATSARRPGANTTYRLVDFLGEVVDSYVTGRGNQHLPGPHVGEMIYNRRARHGFARAWGPLDNREGLLQHRLDGKHLRMVVLGFRV